MNKSLRLLRHIAWRMRSALILCVGLAIIAGSTSVSAQPTAIVAGKWTGKCSGCRATEFTLVLSQNGSDVTGTFTAAGRHAFGDSEKPILGGTVSGNRLSFQVKGDPGDLANVDLTVQPDGKTMEGTEKYRGSFSLRFTRASE